MQYLAILKLLAGIITAYMWFVIYDTRKKHHYEYSKRDAALQRYLGLSMTFGALLLLGLVVVLSSEATLVVVESVLIHAWFILCLVWLIIHFFVGNIFLPKGKS